MRAAMNTFKKIFLLLLAFCVIPLGLFCQSVGITGDSTINRCETKSYTISIQNNSGNPLTNLVIVARLNNLVGFSYVTGTASIDVNGWGAFCTANPAISGGYSGNCAPAPSPPYLTWDIDAQCPGSPFTLNNGDTLNITFSLETDCTAVSGSLNTYIDYTLPGPTPMCDDTGVLNIQVNPGAVTIKKAPNVAPRFLGQDVTWTLTVENTGFGVIENVEVTDVLGAGLAYVSSTQNGDNSGQTTTWTSNEYAALVSMDPGDILTMDITATVIACDNLDNIADVRFGCDPGSTNTCFNTSVDGGTAKASVQRQVRSPNLSYTPPDITFDYCVDLESVGPFTITNVGDGSAFELWINVNFGSITVSNVTVTPLNFTDPAFAVIYNAGATRFEVNNPVPPGGQFELSFDLIYSTWCAGSFPSGDLLWQNQYKDECDNDFFPPVQLSTMNQPANSSSLSVTKTGAPSVIQIGGQITYNITSSYTGLTTCDTPPNSTSDITVVDTIPDGFTVDLPIADGGVYVPGAGGTGGTITWTYTPPASLATSFILNVPDASQCETYCFTTFTNNIQATGTDCCGCTLNASASQTTAIECEELVDSEKTAIPTTGIRCDNIQYTNTYVFADNAALDSVDVSQFVFQEDADNEQQYVPGSLAVTLSGVGDITACATSGLTDTTPGAGGNLIINFSSCSGSVRNRILTITYQLTITEDTVGACNGATFYSWSTLDLSLITGSQCLPDGNIHETTVVSVEPPAMSLSITGLGQIVHKCESQTITITLTQTSGTADPKDVRLVLSGLNYYVVNPAAMICGGVAPVSCTPAILGNDYVWEFGDAFTGSGQSATLQLDVQKRCTGSGDLVARAYFDDNCNDDATYDDTCSTTATETPALLLSGDLLIEKTPETYYAVTNQVQWEIYVTNRGTGTAYNVWVDDVLGSGLLYEHGVNPVVVDNMTGVTINDSLDHNGGAINGASVEIAAMAAGERRQITFIARQVDCNNLTNDVSASWGCIGVDCQTVVTDNSIVNIPAPNLINTNTITPAGGVDACSSPDGFITLRNAGQITCYNLQVTENLPPNLLYISGSTRWRLNGGPWNGPNVAYDPNPTTSPLVWTSTEIPGLATSTPGDTIEIEFDMTSDCPFTGGNITCSTQYENPCADVFTTAVSTFTAAFNAPDIILDKTRANDPIDCNDAIQWTITVTNNSGYTLPIIWIEDTMDATFTYASSVGDPPYTSDNGTNVGQVVTWELRNVNHGDTVTLTLNATTDSAPCSPDLDNTVIAYWGCGLADGSSATKPGVDAPDDTLCLTSTGVTDVRTETRQPDLGYLSIAMSPGNIDACNDSTQLTIVIENSGPVDAYTIDLAITLPSGITYNAGTAESGLGTDTPSATAAVGAIGDPAISGSTITFYDFGDKGSNLAPAIQATGGNDTLVLRFTVQSACYVTDDVDFDLRFYDCCDDTQYSETTSQTLIALFPSLTVTKTANFSQVDCGSNVEYTIQVTNNGTGNTEVIRVVDTLGDWLDYAGNFTEDQPGTITPALIGGNPQVVGWEFNNLGPGATATFTFEATLNPDGLPNQNDCTAALRQNNVTAQWACGTSGDATDDDPNTTAYDCTDSGSANAGPVTLEMPNLVVTNITPDISCTSDGTFSGTVSVRVTNNGDGDTSGTFTVEVTDGNGWTGTGTYGLAIASGGFADVTINTGTWAPDCQPCGTPYSFNATVDLNNDICECDESDNTTGSPTTYTVPIPDLAVDSNALAVVCTDDGQVTITGTVTLINNGCNTAITSNIPMRFTLYDNTGCAGGVLEQWTDTFSSVNIAAGGGTQAFAISNHTFTSNMCLDSTGCQVSIFVEADYDDSGVCECDGTNNTYCADNIPVDIPDIEVDSDTLTVTCLDDGQVTVSGTVTLANNGCGSNLNSNIPMRFTLYDNTGCAGSQVDQWTQTFAGVNIPSGGGTQVFAITPQTVTSDMVTNSTGCQVSIRVEADYNDSVCECDGTDNTYCADNKNIDIPDLQVSSDTLGIACLDDGQFTVSGTVTMVNNGCGSNLNNNIPVRLTIYDNTDCTGNQVAQWTETFAGVNIPALGGTQVFAITPQNITANLCINSAGCQVSVRVEADYSDTICESDGTDNSLCSNKTVNIPDLTINSVTPSFTCVSDGNLQGTVTVNISNIGCGDANGALVRLASDCGIVFADQTINLTAGSSADVTFNYTPNCGACTCTFTATVDPGNIICECDGTNNTLTSAPFTMTVPDIEVQADTLAVTCAGDNQVTLSGTVTLVNNGCGANLTTDIPMRFTLLDNTGCSGNQVYQWSQTFTGVNMASGGGTQVFTVTSQTIASNLCTNSTGCQVSIYFEADYNNSVCECDGTDNTYCADNKPIDIPDLRVTNDTLAVDCFADGQVTVSGTVTMANVGCGSNLTQDIPVRFTMFDNTGCGGNQLLQWTETLSSVFIPSGGGTQVFTISPQTLTTNMVTNSTNCQFSILVEADYNDTICECDGTNNTYCADNIPVDIPNLEVQSDNLDFTCTDDGQFRVSGTVTVVNNGCGSNLSSNIPVRFTLFDNTGCSGNQLGQWTETLTGINIAAGGGTQTCTITPYNLALNLCANSTNCRVSIFVELDHTNTICESSGTDNTLCSDKTLNIPELIINSVANTVVCLDDGSLAGTTVNVSNTGCGNAAGVVVRLVSDCGLTFTDQTIDLTAGQTAEVFFPFTAGITTCTCNFVATIDPDNTICECDGTNNTRASTQDMIIPDLEIQSEALIITCLDDGVIRVSGTVSLMNNGCGPNLTDNIPMRFTLFGRPGCIGSPVNQWTQTFTGVSITSAGGTQTFTIQPHDISTNFCTNSLNCRVSIRIEADYTNSICEWDGTDNTYCTDKTSDCLDLEAISVTANTNCTEDAALNGTIAVTVRSSGGNPITRDFYVRVDDGQGWSSELRYNADLGGTLPLAAGASSTVTFPWNRTFDTEICQFTNITAQVDSRNDICQCTIENDTIATSYQLPLANLRPTAITPSCSSDGYYLVKVTIENNGCSDAGPFTIHLEDNRGNSKDITIDGLETGSPVDIDFIQWPASCAPNTVTFTATVDTDNDVCEITGTDNTLSFQYIDTSPDLVITKVEPSTTCKSPGNINGTIDVTVMNNGSGALTGDFKIIIDDGQGWTSEQFYQADLNGTLPIPVGGTAKIPVNWNRDFTKEPFTCDFNNITVRLDVLTNVCECAAGNNDTIVTYRMPYPDLSLDSLLPICSEDGKRQLRLTISNKGCDDQEEDFNITFTDNTGQSQTASFTAMGGTLPLKKGAPQTINLAAFEFDCTGTIIEYTAAVSTEGGICDILDTNNTLTTAHTMVEPDLLFGDIEWTCNADGSITFTITVTNTGFGSTNNVPVAVYDENGNAVFSITVDLAPGASQQFSFTTGSYPQGQDLGFRFVVDENQEICECNGDNNQKNTTIRCEGGEPQLKLTLFCPPGLEPGGLFRFELKIENTGEIDLINVRIEDFLPDGFQYVTGSASLGGVQIADPHTGLPLVFEIGTLEAGAGVTLIFTAVADADIDPGRYANEARATANVTGTTAVVESDKVRCYTVVVRKAGEGCCLDVEEWALAPGLLPEGPLSFIEPYFHTESAMFMTYAIFNLWDDLPLEKGKLPLFMKERLQNYARSTIEEFYLGSHLGLTLADGTLWLSYAGAYPDQENKNETQKGWTRKQVDETMTASQIAFELLALNEAAKVEERQEIKEKLKDIIEKKLTFLGLFLDDLPHAWEVKEKVEVKVEVEEKLKQGNLSEFVKKFEGKANLYDKAALYLAMVELNKNNYNNPISVRDFQQKLRVMLKSIDNRSFDHSPENLRGQFLFIIALLEAGETDQAKAKVQAFEKILIMNKNKSKMAAMGNTEEERGTTTFPHNAPPRSGAAKNAKGREEEEKQEKVLNNLHDYAMAAYLSRVTGGDLYQELTTEMKKKYYLRDAGIFADKQPDFTFKMNLHSLAPLVLSFDTKEPEKQEQNAVVLYRTFDEVGLFLKKRNLMIGKPLYSLLKNYPFSEPLLPILSFTKAKRGIAPVFSNDAVVHSTRVKPLGEILIPQTFSRILSPAYENGTAKIAALSFGLQYFGGKLMENNEQVIKEEGRSFVETGKKYMDSLFTSGAGIQVDGVTVLLHESLATKGQKQSQYNLEPVNSNTQFSTEALANYLLAETLYIEGGGKHADKAKQMIEIQRRIVETFKEKGYIPKTFGIFMNEDTNPQQFTILSSKEQAEKITIAKLYQALGGEFFLSALKNANGELTVEDLIFLSSAPELISYFKDDIKKIVEYKDSGISNNAADIIGRRLLGMEPKQIAESVENLFKHWDKEAEVPKSNRIENIEKGLIYHYEPQHLLLYLLALQDQTAQFRFKRTLNFFTYMLENEWGVEWTNSFITLPSMEYLVFREEPRKNPEPGDLLNIKVRVDNTCPEGFGQARDLGSVYLKALFTPSLVYMGTEPVDGLHVLGDFQWQYDGMPQGALLEYIYQAYVPYEFNDNFINGSIYAGGRQGFEDFGPDSGIGDRCEDIDHIRRLNFIPLEALQGLVFEDKNINGIKDDNEIGVPNILIKDTRGRMFRSNAEGRFILMAGDEYEGLQLELKSLPDAYVLLENPTKLVNRRYAGEIYFPLVPCETVMGFVYVDENQNGAYDEGEARPEGVLLKAKDKEVITGKDGKFVFRNLPTLWKQWIEVKKEQLYYKGSVANLKFQIEEK